MVIYNLCEQGVDLMSILHLKENVSENVSMTNIIDPKFKTNSIYVKMIAKLDPQTAPLNAVALGIIGSSNIKYKNLSELTKKLNSLYGTNIGVDVTKRGDMQVLTIKISSIDDSYTLNNEKISDEVVDILMDCIFRPNVINGEFAEDVFNFRKKDLLDSIESEINNKRSYAILRAQKQIFLGEASENSSYGSRDTAENITSKQAYEAYINLIQTSKIEIYYVGKNERTELKERFTKEFSKIEMKTPELLLNSFSPLKQNVKSVTETLDVNQTKMVLAFKSDSKNIYAIKLMSTILGETPFSKLFANVREKLSLCYYCASGYNESKGTLMIDCGIEKANIEKARTEIINQLNDIASGNFTDEETESSVLSILNSLKGIGDTPSSLASWYFSRMCRGEIITPEEEIKRIRLVTRDEIIEAAKSFKLDTVYVMTGEEESNE
jgi:predicted Zn-dependent peptidase